jgi:hypothetical protein
VSTARNRSKPSKKESVAKNPPVVLPPDLDRLAYNKDRRFAAAFLGRTVEGFETMHKRGDGPPFKRIGRLRRYSVADLIAYMQSLPTETHRRPAA